MSKADSCTWCGNPRKAAGAPVSHANCKLQRSRFIALQEEMMNATNTVRLAWGDHARVDRSEADLQVVEDLVERLTDLTEQTRRLLRSR